MVYLHKALRGKNTILDSKLCKSKIDEAYLFVLIESLEEDILLTLKTYDTRKIKGSKHNVCEIKLGKLRILYILVQNDIYILHVFKKQKNKTEKMDINCAEKRAKETLN